MKTISVKKFLFVSAGVLMGFSAGAWTPLGELGSWANVKTLALKSDRLSSFVGAQASAPAHEKVSEKFQPYVAMVQTQRLSTLSLTERSKMVRLFVSDLKQDETKPLINKKNNWSKNNWPKNNRPGQNAIFADSPNAELARVIGAIESENQQITAYLNTKGPTSPEYHLTRSIYESNNQWLETLRFMVQKNNGSVSATTAGTMTPRLESLRQKVEESAFLGRQLIRDTMAELSVLEAISPEEKAFRDRLLTFMESYSVSFEIEESLATLVTDYPGLIALSVAGHDVGTEIDTWDDETLTLVTERMELKELRRELAMNLSGPTKPGPTS